MIAQRTTAASVLGERRETVDAARTKLESVGLHVARYSLALVLVWIGAMKFTAYEAGAIEPLVANSPLMSWLYAIFSVQATSNLIGVAEIAAGVLIALRPWSAMACVLGSLMGIATFVTTLTILFSTPGWEPSLTALSVAPGQFILKDAVLLDAAIWSFGGGGYRQVDLSARSLLGAPGRGAGRFRGATQGAT
jgi:reactive chlorine resistance protein C